MSLIENIAANGMMVPSSVSKNEGTLNSNGTIITSFQSNETTFKKLVLSALTQSPRKELRVQKEIQGQSTEIAQDSVEEDGTIEVNTKQITSADGLQYSILNVSSNPQNIVELGRQDSTVKLVTENLNTQASNFVKNEVSESGNEAPAANSPSGIHNSIEQAKLQYTLVKTAGNQDSLIKQAKLEIIKGSTMAGTFSETGEGKSMVNQVVTPLDVKKADIVNSGVTKPQSIIPEVVQQNQDYKGVSLPQNAPVSSKEAGSISLNRPVSSNEINLLRDNLIGVKTTENNNVLSQLKGNETHSNGLLATNGYAQASAIGTLQNHEQQNIQGAKVVLADQQTGDVQQPKLEQQALIHRKAELQQAKPVSTESDKSEGLKEWVSKIIKPLDSGTFIHPPRRVADVGDELFESVKVQAGTLKDFSTTPVMVAMAGVQQEEWSEELNIEDLLTNSTVQANTKGAEFEFATAQKRSSAPMFLQQIRKIIEQKEMSQGIWTKHSFALEDGENVQISTRKLDGQLHIKVLASHNELQKVLLQQSGQIKDMLQKEYNIDVDFEFDGQQSFGDQQSSDSSHQSAKGQSISLQNLTQDVREEEELIIPDRKMGFNNNEWRG